MVFFTAKNNILRQKMTLTDNGSIQFLARVCPRAKPLVFDPLPPITAVLKHYDLKKWENSHFYRILRQKMTLNDDSSTQFFT